MVAYMKPLAYTLLAMVGIAAAASARPAPPTVDAPAAPVDAAVVASDVLQRLDGAWIGTVIFTRK